MSNHLDPRRIDAYLDDELSAGDLKAVERHLSACADCAEAVARQASLFEAIEAIPEQAPSSDVAPTVIAIIHKRRRRASAVEWLLLPQLLVAVALLAYALPSVTSELSSQGILEATITSLEIPADRVDLALQGARDGWRSMLALVAEDLAVRVEAIGQIRQLGLVEASPETWWLVIVGAAACWLIGNRILLQAPARRPTVPSQH